MDPILLKQGSDQWLQYRAGKCTGSRVKDVLSFKRDLSPSQKRIDYMIELLSERMSGLMAEHYVSPEMRWGSDMESLARSSYTQRTGNDVDVVGISQHATIEDFCASADGFQGPDGIVEFKCPKTSTHIEWMLADVVPEEHAFQMYAEMACSGRAYCDFASFDPRLPLRHQLFIKRLWRDDKIIAKIEAGVQLFLEEVSAMEARLNERNPPIEMPTADDMDGLGLGEEELNAPCFFGDAEREGA